MQYLLLIHSDETAFAALPQRESAAVVERYGQLARELEQSGALRSAERLRPSGDATVVRRRSGELVVTDGPFAETKEQLGGFYLIDVPNLDEAIAWAGRFPAVEYGCVEIRPVWS